MSESPSDALTLGVMPLGPIYCPLLISDCTVHQSIFLNVSHRISVRLCYVLVFEIVPKSRHKLGGCYSA